MPSNTFSCNGSGKAIENMRMVFLALLLNVHELISAGFQESSGWHLFRILASEKLEWILEHGNSAVK